MVRSQLRPRMSKSSSTLSCSAGTQTSRGRGDRLLPSIGSFLCTPAILATQVTHANICFVVAMGSRNHMIDRLMCYAVPICCHTKRLAVLHPRWVLPLDIVDNSSSFCTSSLGWFFVSGQSGQASSPWSEAHSTSSTARSPTSPAHEKATAPDFHGSQAETGSKGEESTSRAVHRRVVLPAAIAGVRWGFVAPNVCPFVLAAARGALAALHADAQNDSRPATTRDGPAAVETAVPWPRCVVQGLPPHDGPSDSLAQ